MNRYKEQSDIFQKKKNIFQEYTLTKKKHKRFREERSVSYNNKNNNYEQCQKNNTQLVSLYVEKKPYSFPCKEILDSQINKIIHGVNPEDSAFKKINAIQQDVNNIPENFLIANAYLPNENNPNDIINIIKQNNNKSKIKKNRSQSEIPFQKQTNQNRQPNLTMALKTKIFQLRSNWIKNNDQLKGVMQSLGIQPQELNVDSDQEDELKEEKDKNQQNKTQFLSSKMLSSARLGFSPLKRPSKFGGLKSQINLENQLKESVNLLHKQENSNSDQNLDSTPQEKTKPLESPWIKHDLLAGKIQEQPEEYGDDSLILIDPQQQLKKGESEEIISGFKLQKVLNDSEQPINQQQKRQSILINKIQDSEYSQFQTNNIQNKVQNSNNIKNNKNIILTNKISDQQKDSQLQKLQSQQMGESLFIDQSPIKLNKSNTYNFNQQLLFGQNKAVNDINQLLQSVMLTKQQISQSEHNQSQKIQNNVDVTLDEKLKQQEKNFAKYKRRKGIINLKQSRASQYISQIRYQTSDLLPIWIRKRNDFLKLYYNNTTEEILKIPKLCCEQPEKRSQNDIIQIVNYLSQTSLFKEMSKNQPALLSLIAKYVQTEVYWRNDIIKKESIQMKNFILIYDGVLVLKQKKRIKSKFNKVPMKKAMSKSIMNQSSFSKIYQNTNLKQTQAYDDSLEYIETPRSEKRKRAFSTQRNGFNNSSYKQIYQNQSQIFKMEESLYQNQSQEKFYNGTSGQFTQQLLNSNFKQSYSDQLYNLQSNETFVQKIKEKQIQDTNELNDIKTSDTKQIWKKGQTINTNSMNLNEIYDDQIDGEQQNKLKQKKIESQLQFYVAQEQLILLVLDYEDQKEIGESYKKQQVSDLYSKLILWDPFFKNFQKNTVKDMCSLFQVKFVFKGDIIYQQYDRVIEFFYFIWSGSVIQQLEIPYEIKNHWPEKGYKEKGTLAKKCKKYKSFLIPERNFFGEYEILFQKKRKYTMIANQDCILLTLTRDQFEKQVFFDEKSKNIFKQRMQNLPDENTRMDLIQENQKKLIQETRVTILDNFEKQEKQKIFNKKFNQAINDALWSSNSVNLTSEQIQNKHKKLENYKKQLKKKNFVKECRFKTDIDEDEDEKAQGLNKYQNTFLDY